MRIDELTSPAALIDLDRLERNATRMSERMRRLGVRLRPHVKTLKSTEAARYQVRGHFGGITVSTLAEARHFAAAGFDDITLAIPFAADHLPAAIALARGGVRLALLLDHAATLDLLAGCGHRFPVFLKVDCGYHRAGVDPDDPDSFALARRLAASPGVDFRGLLTHAGHSYASRSADESLVVARAERDAVVRFADRLRECGVPVHEVSVGSTPTMSRVDDLTGVTEARPGNYVVFDAFQAAIGSCAPDDAAFSVLATVIGHYPARNRLLINAGALALSKDPGARHVDPDCGFGTVCSVDGRPLPGWRLDSLSQEHGQVTSTRPLDFDRQPIGSRLRIVANHSCLAAACFASYHVVRGDEVVDEWRPCRGW